MPSRWINVTRCSPTKISTFSPPLHSLLKKVESCKRRFKGKFPKGASSVTTRVSTVPGCRSCRVRLNVPDMTEGGTSQPQLKPEWNIFLPGEAERLTHCQSRRPDTKKRLVCLSYHLLPAQQTVAAIVWQSSSSVLIKAAGPRGLIIISGADHTTHRDPVCSFRSASPLIRDQSGGFALVLFMCVCLRRRLLPPIGFKSARLQLHLALKAAH